MNDRQQETLDRLLRNLPKDVTPAPHLWPAIRARLAGKERRTPSFALAASVAVAAAFLASMLTWAVLQVRSLPRGMQAVVVPSAFEEPSDPKYLRARAMVQQTYRERLELHILDSVVAKLVRGPFGRMVVGWRASQAASESIA